MIQWGSRAGTYYASACGRWEIVKDLNPRNRGRKWLWRDNNNAKPGDDAASWSHWPLATLKDAKAHCQALLDAEQEKAEREANAARMAAERLAYLQSCDTCPADCDWLTWHNAITGDMITRENLVKVHQASQRDRAALERIERRIVKAELASMVA